jgi:intermembrane space import and assembly protein 40
MQDCFRLHPEVYGDELADDDEAAAAVDGTTTEGASARDGPEGGADPDAAATKPTSPEPAKTAASIRELTEMDGENGEAESEPERDVTTPSSPPTKPSNAHSTTAE